MTLEMCLRVVLRPQRDLLLSTDKDFFLSILISLSKRITNLHRLMQIIIFWNLIDHLFRTSLQISFWCVPSLLLLLLFSRRVHFDWVPVDDVTAHIFASGLLDLLVRIPRT